MLMGPFHVLSILILRLERVIEKFAERPVYIAYSIKYSRKFVCGASSRSVRLLFALGFFRVEGGKAVRQRLILFLPFLNQRARSSRLGLRSIGDKRRQRGEVVRKQGWV